VVLRRTVHFEAIVVITLAVGVGGAKRGGMHDGFKVDCPAQDDLENPLGDPQEASLAEAINFLATGACSVTAAAAQGRALPRASSAELPSRRARQRQLIGAW
ncbi:MAG: hypothetical protein AAFN78_20145, partial [Pseudomonadota bacterium]